MTFYFASYTFIKQNTIENIYTKLSFLYGDTFANLSIIKSFTLKNMNQEKLNELCNKIR